ncbi:MarR family transcriptional regulator [Stutzerimonas stutzeri]|uniref:MarR family transcriptional regulator n=1 Tax=Stutzerimonas stutzeri TaxID=316 RepID=W8QZJ7_STUST|nr:MarR family transcriptional regulator [Stutzerimonas stutzeri]AHL75764.1 MarR family transcriptional regulator [Stutzerimonas stutzeri]MCQ4331488.1 MarR family transcriptional regulator [Stutzerimonas stutzeri]
MRKPEGGDHVDGVLAQWQNVRPEGDASPMAIFTRVYRLSKFLNRRIAAVFRKHGLHDGEFDLLATLFRSGQPQGLTPNALRHAAVLSSGAMTNRLDRLEAAGMIQRVANPADRRSLLIRLTNEGRTVLLGCLDEYLATLEGIQAPLNKGQRQVLASGLRVLLRTLEEQGDD